MSKQKSKKSALKRFKITATGKIMRHRSFTGHLNVKRSSKQKRRLKKAVIVNPVYAKKLRKAMGLKKAK